MKLIFLGVGNGGTLKLFNTCFVIQNKEGNFLVDTGGSIDIINRLNKVNIEYKSIKHIFISHTHSDHILGLIWLFKKLGKPILDGKIKDNVNIYCNDEVYKAIKDLGKILLPDKFMKMIYEKISFIVLNDRDKYTINGIEYEFFDIKAKNSKQYGFEFTEENKRFIFLGDETANPELYPRIKDADYVTHEVFCLEQERSICLREGWAHATVKDVAEVMNDLNVKNLILYHTEESHGIDRKRLYAEEGKKYYKGNIIVPDEFDELEL